MASKLLNITKSLRTLSISTKTNIPLFLKPNNQLLKSNNYVLEIIRTSTNFFNKLPAEQLWKGVTSVSNAGKKRGRGKGSSKRTAKDLNRGQIIGIGKANILWPGLSAPIIRGRELIQQQKLPEDPDREANLIKLRDAMGSFKYTKLSPIERGWSGAKMPGRSIGPPDPVGEDTFVGFDSRVLELKTIFNMKGNFGRTRRISILTVTGNGNGLAGFALAKSTEVRAALRQSKNRAGQKLMHIDIFDGHTVYHDFYTQFGSTKVFVSQKPKGYGLVCHRAIKSICQVIGIKDLHAKIEGSTNLQHIVKAFFLGLLKQKTHAQIVEDKKLHLVSLSKENNYYPKVLASPSVCRTKEQLEADEILDFKQYCLDGRIVLQRKKFPPFFTKHKSWETHLKKQERRRNQDSVRNNLIARYGEIRSFLTDKYPECKPYKKPPPEKVVEEE